MKNKLMTLVGAAAVFLAVAQTTQATPISGNIGFSGTATLDSGDVATATEVTSWNATVGSESGSFNAIIGSPVTITAPWTFTSGPVSGFWSVGVLPVFTFDLISSTIDPSSGSTFLNVNLTGTVSAAGFDTTAFSGTFQVANPPANGVATFTERLSFNSVPDGGTTMMLLGGALMGLGFIKRKLSA